MVERAIVSRCVVACVDRACGRVCVRGDLRMQSSVSIKRQ